MKQQQLCVNCNNWIIAPRDQFCGWCDMRFSGFEMSLSQEIFFLGADEGKKDIFLIIKSSGRSQVKILDIRTDSELVTIVDPPQKPVVLSAQPDGSRWKLEIDFDRVNKAFKALRESKEINIHVLSDLKADDAKKNKTIRLVPRPDFALKTDKELLLVLDGKNREVNQVTLALTRGWANVKEIKTTKTWATAALIEASLPATLSEQDRKELPIKLEFDEITLNKEIETGRETAPIKFQLAVTCQGMESKPFYLPVEVRTKQPALLEISEGKEVIRLDGSTSRVVERTVLIGSRRRFFEFTFKMSNRGDAALKIEQVRINQTYPWLELKTDTASKPEIKSGEYGFLTLRIDTDAMHLGNAPSGRYNFDLKFVSEELALESQTLSVIIVGKAISEYDGIVAIDFGTTNTCVAIYDPDASGGEPEILELPSIRGTDKSTSIPSMIFYRKLLADNQRDYEIGAKAMPSFSVADAEASLVTSIKRSVGQAKPLTVRYYVQSGVTSDLKPEEIAGDIIREILAEVELKLERRVSRCSITHPVQYVHRRIEALERAFKQADVTIEKKMTEPLAAALDYIFRNTNVEKSYKLMVWDFGGGTTDIAYLRVNIQKTAKKQEIVPELLGADGDRRFGGDDVTASILRHFGRICQNEVNKKPGGGLEVIVDFDRIREITDENTRNRAYYNYRNLWLAAERAKIKVSDSKQQHSETVFLSFWHRQKEETLSPEVTLRPEDLESLIKDALSQTMDYMDDLIKRCDDKTYPDVILLVGNSSRLPLVRKLMEERYASKGSRVVGADNDEGKNDLGRYKEAVVYGLCKYLISEREMSKVKLQELKKHPIATSHIGIRSFDGNTVAFSPIIKKGDPLDKWYPLEDFQISRTTKPGILSCSGRNFELKNNPYIEKIAEFPLAQVTTKFTDEEIQNAELFLQATSDEHVIFKVKIGAQEEEFKAEIPMHFD